MSAPGAPIKGRGASWNPQNRFEKLAYVVDDEAERDESVPRTVYLRDPSRTIITSNDSPDVGFTYSINPYRGCEHGCAYCFARPTHEYLGFSAGLDFETKIMVKEDAPELLREELLSPKWKPEPIAISGVTDPYQPVERKLEVTRRCLAVLADFRNPTMMITKNHLVTRDVDHLGELAQFDAASVAVSITTLDPKLANILEPRASTPELRLNAIETLAKNGIPATVMVAPVIPAITEHEMPKILEAARDASFAAERSTRRSGVSAAAGAASSRSRSRRSSTSPAAASVSMSEIGTCQRQRFVAAVLRPLFSSDAVECLDQPVDVERLSDERGDRRVVEALERVLRCGCDDDDRLHQLRFLGADVVHDLETVRVGQHQVEQDGAVPLAPDAIDCNAAVAGLFVCVAVLGEECGEERAKGLIVFHDQNG